VLYPHFKRIWFNFGVVDYNDQWPRLMRCRWPSGYFIRYLMNNYGLKTMINLEDRYDEDIQPLIDSGELKVIKIWDYFSGTKGPTVNMTREMIEFMRGIAIDKDRPFLVRCQGGADRTGYFCAVYRIVIQGWPKWKAKLEMLTYFHLPFKYPKIWMALDEFLLNGNVNDGDS